MAEQVRSASRRIGYTCADEGEANDIRHCRRRLGLLVGQTEQAIAAAFREAERDGAVLLFDEADSFLRDRRTALQSWEVTQVNDCEANECRAATHALRHRPTPSGGQIL